MAKHIRQADIDRARSIEKSLGIPQGESKRLYDEEGDDIRIKGLFLTFDQLANVTRKPPGHPGDASTLFDLDTLETMTRAS